ncbi:MULTISPECIES: phosphoadenylyl-sulfate reductase [Mycobacteriaceae]|uniref:Adenosine 5'-phosphosulfate reductase n=1 Tax=Mycolicibacterium mucogenicum DSM 44124 TaxID=1226753 RepID=A0A8E4W470_MYCMU|nr:MULTISPECIES: phosphoadenylyl-sulfate reductase [Mycobacteriaceae]KAB7754180.1 phosphoadenosine phosphosulfate reductase [Mycolicibacterium mucogenicum DSM 44124]QPG70957.1 phosphoadenylyl-sulfate reductase [Mycolicibacterium mucogenicum DSM 44124]SEB06069.1 phosphoadenylylsulfate reductase (thioredoxin) [Mycobacterium sp. 283mftsu]
MTDVSETDLRELAARGAAELADATAEELLRWVEENFSGQYVVASNMQDAVLVEMAAKVHPGVDVLFLDTGYHFAETIGTRDAVEAVYGVNIVNVTPEQTVAQQDELVGKDLFASDAARCCNLRKVQPLSKALKGYSAWVTGIRRVEAPTRANAPLISFDEAFGLVKVNPIAAWSDDDMQAYIEANGILVNPLVDEGYPSIGCAPCTQKPAEGADPRSGRWAGLAKTECGLHAS